MAARKSSTLSPRHRDAIQTSMLLKRLQGFALSELDGQTGKPVAMSSDQVRAALGLLRKTMPDLAATHLSGDEESPLVARIEYAWADAPHGRRGEH